jgi:hypothetical protein
MPRKSESSRKTSGSKSNARPSGKARSTRTAAAPARGHVRSPEIESPAQGSAHAPPASRGEKVGSSERAAEHFGGKGDFGIPVDKAQPGQQSVIDGSLDDRPLGTRLPPADPDGRRDVGVGAPDSGPGSGSGGDLDPDIIGLGTRGGLAASPDRRTHGPDITETAIDSNAVGGPAKGDNEMPPGTHTTTGRIQGTVHDRMDRDVHE